MTSAPADSLPKAYDPSGVERRLYEWWESSGFFRASPNPDKEPFTIIMPPPNVTGELHVGHALTAAIEDALVRYHRMRGREALWLPGTDHASIATQAVVERELAKEGLTRRELGRERFLERVWQWVQKYGSYIDDQHRRLGASCDWERDAFTMDPGPSRAVKATFKRLYDKGLIYCGERMINWDPALRTVLSDLEVEHVETEGTLYYIAYLLEDGSGRVTVATTRPETLLGDTAVAVHPDDARYAHLVGKRLLLPVLNRPIPIIADAAVAPDFGAGALKVTPAHDPNDYEIGRRHALPEVNVIAPDGSLNENAGPYEGYDRFDARAAIVEQLRREGLLERSEPHVHAVGHSQRSGAVVEPLISTQWFVHTAPLAQRAMEAVASGAVRIVPDRFAKVYLDWLDNIRDWCISRQLWWGHRIPVWHCADCAHLTVALETPTTCEACGSERIAQDEDVLDTWFSSGLWPHSTLGWPDDTDDLRYFYPTTVMETAYDILFFWVARMVMLGLENMDEVPFKTVYIHGLVRDPQGRKMSKSAGNVVDPIGAIESHGADALRFALGVGAAPGNDSRLSDDRLEAARNFANKVWNAARFVLSAVGSAGGLAGWLDDPPRNHAEDRWILGRLDETAAEVERLWDDFQLAEAQRTVHAFIWNEFCDWYVEMAKVRLRAGDGDPKRVLPHVLDRSLRLLHPFMPFVTEETWQRLVAAMPREGNLPETIMRAPYPQPSSHGVDAQAVADVALTIDIVRAVRNVRAEFHVEAGRLLDAAVDSPRRAALEAEAPAIRQLARIGSLAFSAQAVSEGSVRVVVRDATVSLALEGVDDLAGEIARLRREAQETARYLGGLESRLSNESFLAKAPADVIDRERQRLAEGQARQARLRELLSDLGG